MKEQEKNTGAEFVEALEEIRKDPEQLEQLRREWAREVKRESKKGPAGAMAAMFMKAVRF